MFWCLIHILVYFGFALPCQDFRLIILYPRPVINNLIFSILAVVASVNFESTTAVALLGIS